MAFSDDAFGRLALTDYKKFVPVVAQAYLARPLFEEDATPSWLALQASTDRLFRQMSRKVNVIFTSKDPYPDFETMKHDIETNHKMLVWTGASDHQVWTPKENHRFRAVHDYMIHLAGGHQFTLRGEMGAYNRHVKLAPPVARLALFVEIVAQTCTFLYLDNQFGEQKVCELYGFDFVNVGLYDETNYVLNFGD
jgi:hypothetical protein